MVVYKNDWRYYSLLNKNKNIIKEGSSYCFGDLLDNNPIFNREKNRAVYIEHYFVSNLSRKQYRLFKNYMTELGLFRNVKMLIVNKHKLGHKRLKMEHTKRASSNPIIKIVAKIDTCSPQEYQFVGFIARELANNHKGLLDWFKLIEKHPDEDKFLLYLINHTLSRKYFGHNWLVGGFSSIYDTSIPDLYRAMDSYAKPLKEATSRNFLPDQLQYQVASTWNNESRDLVYSKKLVTAMIKNSIKEKK